MITIKELMEAFPERKETEIEPRICFNPYEFRIEFWDKKEIKAWITYEALVKTKGKVFNEMIRNLFRLAIKGN